VPGRMGSELPMIAPYGAFPTADGQLMIAAANDGLFLRLSRALGLDALTADDRFRDNPSRVAHRPALRQAISEATVRHATAALLALLRGAGVPCAPILDVARGACGAADPCQRHAGQGGGLRPPCRCPSAGTAAATRPAARHLRPAPTRGGAGGAGAGRLRGRAPVRCAAPAFSGWRSRAASRRPPSARRRPLLRARPAPGRPRPASPAVQALAGSAPSRWPTPRRRPVRRGPGRPRRCRRRRPRAAPPVPVRGPGRGVLQGGRRPAAELRLPFGSRRIRRFAGQPGPRRLQPLHQHHRLLLECAGPHAGFVQLSVLGVREREDRVARTVHRGLRQHPVPGLAMGPELHGVAAGEDERAARRRAHGAGAVGAGRLRGRPSTGSDQRRSHSTRCTPGPAAPAPRGPAIRRRPGLRCCPPCPRPAPDPRST
jgi:hypothetical protein